MGSVRWKEFIYLVIYFHNRELQVFGDATVSGFPPNIPSIHLLNMEAVHYTQDVYCSLPLEAVINEKKGLPSKSSIFTKLKIIKQPVATSSCSAFPTEVE